MINQVDIVICLRLIAAKAEQLSQDVANGKLWPGELKDGLAEISHQLERATKEAKDDR